MNDKPQSRLHTEGPVAVYFQIENHLLATAAADAYKATDLVNKKGVSLWLLRRPFPLNSQPVVRFLERMRKIERFDPPVCDLESYAVDSLGTAFAVLPPVDGAGIAHGNLEPAEIERRFMAALRLIARLHQGAVVAGDLSGASFYVSRQGPVHLIGVMGCEGDCRESMPPPACIPYLAPEQRAGAAADARSDVFALGVLGYHLLTGNFPYGPDPTEHDFDISRVAPLSAPERAPVWAAEVLLKCLDPDPSARYSDAAALLQGIGDVRARIMQEKQTPTVRGGSKGGQELIAADAETAEEQEAPRTSPVVYMAFCVFVLAGVLAGILLLKGRPVRHQVSDSKLKKDIGIHREVLGDESLQKAVDVLGESKTSIGERASRFEELATSDDPLAHNILVQSAVDATSPEERRLAEKGVLDRARRLGLMRAADQVAAWLRGIRGNDLPESYAPLLNALNVTLPPEARAKAIEQAVTSNPAVTLRVTGALAIDAPHEVYRAALLKMLADSLPPEQASAYSTNALILAQPDLAALFAADIVQKKEEFSDADISWLLSTLSERNDINTRAIASLALERNILPPIRKVFLEVVRDRADLPPNIVRTLTRAAGGVLTSEDIGNIGRWFDIDSEKVLLAVCADTVDIQVQRDAFDTVAGKSLSREQAGALIDWVRSNYWDKREEFVHLIGVIANSELLGREEVEKAIAVLSRFARDSRLMDLLLEPTNPMVVRAMLEKYGDSLSIGRLLNLLASPDKDVRVQAINRLAGNNNIGVAKIIIDHYEREKDPAVRELYAKTFWFVKRRVE